jgi:hypothetical protein
MAKRTTPPTPSNDEVRVLLERYRCPVQLHAVRTRFLGNIASPDMQASPIEALWGGELPPFDTMDAANELIGALVMGLWNQLARHQERAVPFRLIRLEVPARREGMAKFARLRREELEGFVDGLFGDKESLDLPERAHKALSVLAEIRGMLEASQVLAEDPTKPAEPGEIAVTLSQFRELTRIAEHEMHEAVLSCTHARRRAHAQQHARLYGTARAVTALVNDLNTRTLTATAMARSERPHSNFNPRISRTRCIDTLSAGIGPPSPPERTDRSPAQRPSNATPLESGRLQIGTADITSESESVADIKSECLADLLRNTQR